jgi:D-arabinose 1-dehydrogenase-like Zn-dependent alcohol dehydrogenase
VAGDITVNSVVLLSKGASVHGWPAGSAIDCQDAIEVAQLQDIHCLIEKFPLEKAQEALDHMMSGNVRFRAVLTID